MPLQKTLFRGTVVAKENVQRLYAPYGYMYHHFESVSP